MARALCKTCGKKLSSNQALLRHMMSQHTTEQERRAEEEEQSESSDEDMEDDHSDDGNSEESSDDENGNGEDELGVGDKGLWEYIMKKHCFGQLDVMDIYDGEEEDADYIDDDGVLYQYNVDNVIEKVFTEFSFAERLRTRIIYSDWDEAITHTKKKFEISHDMDEDEANHAAWQLRKYKFINEIMPHLYSLDNTEKDDEDDNNINM